MPMITGPNAMPANVDHEGRLTVQSTEVSMEHHVNKDEGLAFTWQFSEDPDANDDCIFYLKNNDDKVLVLEGIDLFITSDCDVFLKIGGSGTTATGTTITGANLNAGSGNVADVTCIHDGDIEAGGTFTRAVECNRFVYESGTLVDTHHINFVMDIIIPKNQVFSIWVDTAGVVIKGTLYGWFHD